MPSSSRPYGSLRDLVLKELQHDRSLLVWADDRSFADSILSPLLVSEAYILDDMARDYLSDIAGKLTHEDYYQSIAHMRMPFSTVWIETDIPEEDESGTYVLTHGALVEATDEGIRVMSVFTTPDIKPWTPVYSGAQITFHRDGTVSPERTPIATLYKRMGERKGYTPEGQLNGDIDRCLRIAGLFSVMCAVLERQDILQREEPQALRKSQVKALKQASREVPRFGTSVIRLSRIGRRERDQMVEQRTAGKGGARSAHWVRGHLFLARNGKLTWRRAHVRGDGAARPHVNRVTV